jgi:hypothetical protein
MSKEQFEQASKNLYEKMIVDGVMGIMQYKPFSDEYWRENPRIVICNYENVGFQDSQINSVSFDDFRNWITYKKGKTVHFTAVFVNTLIKLLHNEEFPVVEMKKSYCKIDDLHKSMKNIMYMNLRPTSAKGNRQEVGETHKIIYKYKNEMRAYLEALDANIFVLSTKDSVDLFNFVFNIKDKPLMYKKNKWVNNTIVFSVRHFGRPNYNYWYKAAQDIKYIWDHR